MMPRCALHIKVRRLEQLEEDVFHVLAHVARLGKAGCVRNGKRDVEHARQSLRQVGLTGTGGTKQQNVGLSNLYVLIFDLLAAPFKARGLSTLMRL